MPTPAIGIDLGTTFSVIAHLDEKGKPQVIRNAEGETTTPSVVSFGSTPPLVGRPACDAIAEGETEYADVFKRNIGDANYRVSFAGRDWTAIDLSALVLAKLKEDAERGLGQVVREAVITVPAYFQDAQREATQAAARQAGLEPLTMINEPTAAALAYGLRESVRSAKFLVYDLGGGTFDVTLVEITPDKIDILGSDGDHHLGGKDWDKCLAGWLRDQCLNATGIDVFSNPQLEGEVMRKAEAAKRALSAAERTRVLLQGPDLRHAEEVTRSLFEDLTRDRMERTRALCESLLHATKTRWEDLGGVLLVGGSSRMPAVHRFARELSGKPPLGGINVDEAVALGAAVEAGRRLARRGEPQVLGLPGRRAVSDVMSHSLGMIAESADGSKYINSIILVKNRPIPSVHTRPFQLRTRSSQQNELEVYVTQGESEIPRNCAFVGRYRFSEIAHAPGGVQVLDISYAYDDSGIVHVTAVERDSGRKHTPRKEPVPEDMSWLEGPPRRGTLPLTAYLAIDLSGSMSGAPLRAAQEAARAFVRESDLSKCSIGLVEFADSVRIAVESTQNAKVLEDGIASMAIGRVGGSNAASPIGPCLEQLATRSGPRFIIILTDGIWYCQPLALAEAARCREAEIQIIAVGFGSADAQFLKEIASADSAALHASLGTLTETFGSIAREMTETAGGQLAALPDQPQTRQLRFLKSHN